ncbi:MAG TPA: hypothetical protein VGO58_13580 [Chitinophagaceae bacterium]|jgi:hypothetical protein|nr:hypothetical protein [Chitinophagaceae bacterium]
MKKILLFLFLVPVLSYSQGKDVVIRIMQDGVSHRLDEFQTMITLKKKTFKFQILLNNVEGLYVFASIKDSVYRFTENSPIRDFSYLKLLELREADKFNINKELNISETGWSYWFYKDSADWHSFARKTVGMGNSGVVCTKIINKLYHTEMGETIKLRSLDTPLYLFFIAVKDYDANGKPSTELMRRKVKIDWVEDD